MSYIILCVLFICICYRFEQEMQKMYRKLDKHYKTLIKQKLAQQLNEIQQFEIHATLINLKNEYLKESDKLEQFERVMHQKFNQERRDMVECLFGLQKNLQQIIKKQFKQFQQK